MGTRGYVSVEEVRHALEQLYRSDAECSLQSLILESFSDELKPVDANGRRRFNPFLKLSFLLLCTLAGMFVCFFIGGH